MGNEPASSMGDVEKIAYSELPRALEITAGDLRWAIERYLQIEDRLDTTPDNAPGRRVDLIDDLAALLLRLDTRFPRGGK